MKGNLILTSMMLVVLIIIPFFPVNVLSKECDKILYLHLRGSGQNNTENNIRKSDEIFFEQPEGDIFDDKIRSSVDKNITVKSESLDYPAWKTNMQFFWAEFDPGNKNNDGYFMSKNMGITMLKDRLEIANAACPSQRIVLSGHSQGAHAIGDALTGIPKDIQNQIDYIGLFGDPRFNPDSYAARGDFVKKEYFGRSGGVLEIRDEFPESYHGKINSFCLHDDGICENRYSKIKNGKHNDYSTKYVPVAAKEAAGRLAQSLLKKSSETNNPKEKLQPEVANTLNSIISKPTDVVFIVDSNGQLSGYEYSNYLNFLNPEPIISNQLIQYSGTNSGVILLRDLQGNELNNTHASIKMKLSHKPEELAMMKAYIKPTPPLFNYTAPLLDGLLVAGDQMTWRTDVEKNIIVLTDEDTTDISSDGKSIKDVALSMKQKNIEVSVVTAEMLKSILADYQHPDKNKEIVSKNGYYIFSKYNTVTQGVETILNNIRSAPKITMNAGSYAAAPNENIYFSAANSSLQPGTSIASYEWDFDGDGKIDTTTTAPTASHAYNQEATYTGTVKTKTDADAFRETTFTVTVSETFRTSSSQKPLPPDSTKFFNLEKTNLINRPVSFNAGPQEPTIKISSLIINSLFTQKVSAQSEDKENQQISVYSIHDQNGRLLRLVPVEDFPVEIPPEVIVANNRIGIAAHNDFGGSLISYHTITASEKAKAEEKSDPKKVSSIINSRNESQLRTNENSSQPIETKAPDKPDNRFVETEQPFVIKAQNGKDKNEDGNKTKISGDVLGDKKAVQQNSVDQLNPILLVSLPFIILLIVGSTVFFAVRKKKGKP